MTLQESNQQRRIGKTGKSHITDLPYIHSPLDADVGTLGECLGQMSRRRSSCAVRLGSNIRFRNCTYHIWMLWQDYEPFNTLCSGSGKPYYQSIES